MPVAQRLRQEETSKKAPFRKGDTIKVVHSNYWANDRTFTVHDCKRQSISGYDSTLDLGWMVVIWATFKSPGKPGWHMVPAEWCELVKPPKLRGRK